MTDLKLKRPSPALVVAMVALFVALGGTAGAVVAQAVPLAKRALVAENAKRLGGQTPAQVAAVGARAALTLSPAGARPASTAASLLTTKTGTGQIAAGGAGSFTVVCDAGQKVVGGGYSSDQVVLGLDSYPSNETTWSFFLGNLNDAAAATVSLYATCLK